MATAAGAQPAEMTAEAISEHLAAIGTWQFSATALGPDGRPECFETWYFDADGTGWIQSGEQRVVISWRSEATEGRRPLQLHFQTSLSSDEGPDCLGRAVEPDDYPRDERGFVITFANSSTALICGHVGVPEEWSSPLALGRKDCWGRIKPAPEG